MATVEIGIRIDIQTGIAFFGVDEINQRIAAGARVLEVRPGGAIMSKVGEESGHETLTLSGCQIEVVLSDD
jgi:hypothetical protein